MRFLKALLGLLLSVAVVFGSTAGALASSSAPGNAMGNVSFAAGNPGFAATKHKTIRVKIDFRDWNDNYWAADAIARMLLRKIVIGDGGRIWPDRHVTRLEALLTLYRLYEWESYRGTRNANTLTRDLDEAIPDWGYDAVIEGLHRKIIDKRGKKLGLMDKLTRLEATVLLVRAAGLEAEAIRRAGEDLRFRDENAIPRDYRGYVAVAVENGLIKGYPNGVFQPNKPVTRAEWFSMLARLEDFFPPVTSPGRLDQLRGKVTAVQSGARPSLTINTSGRSTGGTTYRVAAEHEVFVDGRRASLTDARAGDSVWVFFDENGDIIWASVTTEATKVSGRISAWRAPSGTSFGSVTVVTGSGSAATERTFNVATTATVQVGKYQPSFDDVAVGQQATLTVQRDVVTHLAIDETTGTVKGTLVSASVSDSSRSIRLKDSTGRQTDYPVAKDAKVIAQNGAEIDFTLLVPGDELEVRLDRGVAQRIKVTKALGLTVEGTVTAFSAPDAKRNGGITVSVPGSGGSSTTKTYGVSPSATVRVDGKAGRYSDVQVGDDVKLLVHNNLVSAIDVRLATTIEGTIESTGLAGSDRVITVTESGKQARSYVLTDSATLTSPYGDPLRFADLAAGDKVELTLVRGAVAAVKVVVAKEMSLAGTVKSIGLTSGRPSSLVLTRGSGSESKDLTLTVSPSVAVTHGGDSFAFADLRQGDQVDVLIVEGTVTSITVTKRAPIDVSWTGIVAEHDADARTYVLKVGSGSSAVEHEIRYTTGTSFTINGHPTSAAALTDGSRVTVNATDADGIVTASKVEIEELAAAQ